MGTNVAIYLCGIVCVTPNVEINIKCIHTRSRKLLISCVGSFISSQASSMGKSLFTMATVEGFLPGMDLFRENSGYQTGRRTGHRKSKRKA